jgi:GNAT superfamily N-acetyltransferase
VRYRLAEAEHEFLNLVYGARLAPGTVPARIRDMVATVGRDGRAFFWTIWPSDGPADLAEYLIAAGFEDHGSDPLMTLALEPGALAGAAAPPVGLVVEEATTRDRIADIARFAVGSLGDESPGGSTFAATLVRLASEQPPRLRLFGGWADDRLVSTSGLFTGAGVAGIIAVATDPDWRGRGFGRALTAAAIEAGRRAGFDTASLMASDMGQPVYRRLGFEEVGRVRFLRWPGTVPG